MFIDVLSVLCAQLTRDLLAIAKFLLIVFYVCMYVFKCLLKVADVDWRRMCFEKRFQAAGPAYPKARSPNLKCVSGTT